MLQAQKLHKRLINAPDNLHTQFQSIYSYILCIISDSRPNILSGCMNITNLPEIEQDKGKNR